MRCPALLSGVRGLTPPTRGAAGDVRSLEKRYLFGGYRPPVYRRLKLCSNNGGYEAIPEEPTPLDLRSAKEILVNDGIPVVDARVMLIASLDPEVTISRSGRLLFKTQDARAAERAFDRLRGLLGLPAMENDRSTEGRGG